MWLFYFWLWYFYMGLETDYSQARKNVIDIRIITFIGRSLSRIYSCRYFLMILIETTCHLYRHFLLLWQLTALTIDLIRIMQMFTHLPYHANRQWDLKHWTIIVIDGSFKFKLCDRIRKLIWFSWLLNLF